MSPTMVGILTLSKKMIQRVEQHSTSHCHNKLEKIRQTQVQHGWDPSFISHFMLIYPIHSYPILWQKLQTSLTSVSAMTTKSNCFETLSLKYNIYIYIYIIYIYSISYIKYHMYNNIYIYIYIYQKYNIIYIYNIIYKIYHISYFTKLFWVDPDRSWDG